MINKKSVLITLASFVGLASAASAYYLLTKDKAHEPTDMTSNEQRISSDETTINRSKKTKSARTNPSVKPPKNIVEISKIWHDATTKSVVAQTKLTGSGFKTCEITFSKGSSRVIEKADVIYQPEFSTCAGFSIKTSRFPSAGEWSVVLKVIKDDGSRVASQTKTIGLSTP